RGLRRRTHHRAPRGGAGSGALRHGASGEDLLIAVPPGTQVQAADEGLHGGVWDLVADGERAVVARGGTGGCGNKRFAGPARQAPQFAERGLAGERGWLELKLKLLADVGLVGLPNAGKSSLLARLTRATPKVAAYPFTTLEPVLGVLERDERQIVLADIPGLIEGASAGAGLGDEFLAHVERTRLLVHVVDLAPDLFDDAAVPDAGGEPGDGQPGAPEPGEIPALLLANHVTIERELESYDARLADLPRILVLSKRDLVSPQRLAAATAAFTKAVGEEVPIVALSSATGEGCEELAQELLRRVEAADRAEGATTTTGRTAGTAQVRGTLGHDAGGQSEEEEKTLAGLPEHMVFRPGPRHGFTVRRTAEGTFEIEGPLASRLIGRFDLGHPEAHAYVESRLRRLGVLGALAAEGYEPGDPVLLAGVPVALSDGAAGGRGRRRARG
ncbi:MAG: Obg family GTPase CgtA, partial [Acidobacteriota bacterium]|nr:Obg family GTPase CgtA [Acidobacteriota bacterium]